jgi:phosphatidylinositol dimannoside acyltransferase
VPPGCSGRDLGRVAFVTGAAPAPDVHDQQLGSRDRLLLALLLSAVRVLERLPDGIVYRGAAGIGLLCYLAMPGRRSVVRENLRLVTGYLARTGKGSARARRAADDDRRLEAMVRAAFMHWARTYAESALASAWTRLDIASRVDVPTPETVQRALHPVSASGRIYIGFHYGALELAGAYAAQQGDIDVAGPMERVANPLLRSYFEYTRRDLGVELLTMDGVAARMTARLKAGQGIAIVADRVVTGQGAPVTLFGAPTRLPRGAALLAAESGAETFVVTMSRVGWNRWSTRVDELHVPAEGSRREKVAAALREEVRILEENVGRAPEQWWSLLFPIWSEPATVAEADG